MAQNKKSTKVKKASEPAEIPLEKDESGALVENLYKKNIEILNQNKTLSLLRKLYEMSILTLNPKELALRISQTVQVDLNFELVSILIFDSKSNSLDTLASSQSERMKEVLQNVDLSFDEIKIPNVSAHAFFLKAI